MSESLLHKLQDACLEPGCPVCMVVQKNTARHLANQFYENVNSPKWRERLRGSLGFCQEHAWLSVDRRLGDALGLSIIYRDILNHILIHLEDGTSPARSPRQWSALLRQIPEQTRAWTEKVLYAITPRKRCPVCEYREETTRDLLSALVKGLEKPEVVAALQASHGLCLPHLQEAFEKIRDIDAGEKLLAIHREKMESLKTELEEFIRKNDYRKFQEGFGSEGDAWLRAIALLVGRKKI